MSVAEFRAKRGVEEEGIPGGYFDDEQRGCSRNSGMRIEKVLVCILYK